MTKRPPRAPGIVPPALASMQQVDTSIAGVEHLKPIVTVIYLTAPTDRYIHHVEKRIDHNIDNSTSTPSAKNLAW